MSFRPIRFANSIENAGAVKQFTLTDEDYLAYVAGKHLSEMVEGDPTTLTNNSSATTLNVGTYVDTVINPSEPSEGPRTHSRVYNVNATSVPSNGTNTLEYENPVNLPSLVYVDDTVSITVLIDATNAGNGFEEIQTSMTIGQASNNYVINSTVINPVAGFIETTGVNAEGITVSWEDFSSSSTKLQGQYSATYDITFTDIGYMTFEFSTTVTDTDNAVSTASDFFTSFIRVERSDTPGISEIESSVYQNSIDVVQEEGDDRRYPIFYDRWRRGLKETNDLELDAMCQRIVSNIMSHERSGTYRLASESPGSDWQVSLPNIFVDTRYDGTAIGYSIWNRKSEFHPTPYKPLMVRRDNNNFDGLQEMTEDQVKFTFGERAKRIIIESGIGRYQLRSSEQGPPTDEGTWIARGVALDTRVSYNVNEGYESVSTYATDYEASFLGILDYETEYQSTYTTDYATDYESSYDTQYLNEFSEPYEGTYISTYQGGYETDYLTDYEQEYEHEYEGTYSTDFEGTTDSEFYQTSYTGEIDIEPYDGEYQGALYEASFEGIYAGPYSTDYETIYSGEYQSSFDGDYAATFDGDYEGSFDGDYAATFDGDYEGSYQGSYAATFDGQYEPDYIGSYTATFDGQYEPDYIGSYTATFDGQYEGSYQGGYAVTFTGQYTGTFEGTPVSVPYQGDPVSQTFEGTAASQTFDGTAVSQTFEGTADSQTFEGSAVSQTFEGTADSQTFEGTAASQTFEGTADSQTFDGTAASQTFEGTAASETFDDGNPYTATFTGSYTPTFTGSYTPTFTGSYTPTFTGSYTPTFTGSYTPTFTGSYTPTFTGSYTPTFTGSYTPTFTGNYQRTYVGPSGPLIVTGTVNPKGSAINNNVNTTNYPAAGGFFTAQSGSTITISSTGTLTSNPWSSLGNVLTFYSQSYFIGPAKNRKHRCVLVLAGTHAQNAFTNIVIAGSGGWTNTLTTANAVHTQGSGLGKNLYTFGGTGLTGTQWEWASGNVNSGFEPPLGNGDNSDAFTVLNLASTASQSWTVEFP